MGDSDNHGAPAKCTDEPAPTSQAVPENTTPNTDEAPSATKPQKYPPGAKFDRAMLRWTRVVGFFTAILAIVGLVQTCSFIQSERAFVIGSPTFIKPFPLEQGKPISVGILIHNTGRTAAVVIDSNTTYAYQREPLPTNPHYVPNGTNTFPAQIGAGVIFRGTFTPQSSNGQNIAFSKDGIAELSAGTMRFYVFGWVKWKDDFSWFGPETTGFCGVFDPDNPPDTAFDSCGLSNYTYAR